MNPSPLPTSPGRLRSLSSFVIIVAGLVVTLFAARNMFSDYQRFNSPLDQADYAVITEDSGFVPVYSSEEETNPSFAPTLSGSTIPLGGLAPTPTSTPVPNGSPTRVTSGIGNIPSPTPTVQPAPPDRIVIPVINLDAPVVPVGIKEFEFEGAKLEQWVAPNERAAGWHDSSALPGTVGNTVLNGHHNVYGEVFRDLEKLREGDQIFLTANGRVFVYRVGLILKLKERFQPVEIRLQNAQWTLPSGDERLTLITCWPYESNTHRLVIVALPDQQNNDAR